MENKVRSFIARYRLLEKQSPVLVALSGGADSVALLCVLLGLGYRCVAAHVNFRLRGTESDRDEEFVRALCRLKGVPLRVASFPTREYAAEHGVSIEMAARDLRYSFFNQLMEEGLAPVTAVAHHRDDQAETLLLNLLRGSGLHGLRGMKPRNGRIIRPLLDCSRQEVLQYLEQAGQSYVTDSSNLRADVLRNRIRLEVMPLLAELQPQVKGALAHSATYLSQAEDLLNEAVAQRLACYRLPLQKVGGDSMQNATGNTVPQAYQRSLCKDAHASLLLHEWLAPVGFNTQQQAQIEALGQTEVSGRRFESATHVLWLERDRLTLYALGYEEPLPTWDYVCLPIEKVVLDKDPRRAFLDADKVSWPLRMRRVQSGDRFRPFGLKGSKLVSDYLTDRKCSVREKQQQAVLVDAHEQIVWLVGQRIDDRYRLNDTTLRVLAIKLLD